MIQRQLQTIFCDDIRHEIGGKLSYIGTYSTSLLVTSFPTTLPKLCVAIKAWTSVQSPFESFAVRITKDDEVLQELAIEDQRLAESAIELRSKIPEDERQDAMQAVQFLTAFSPMVLTGPCVLRVRATVGENEELRGPGLKVEQAEVTGQGKPL